MRVLISMALAMFLTAGSLAVFAADENDSKPEHGRHKPPQVAFDACKDLTENASCQFSGRNNEVVIGVCSLPPAKSGDATLACRPDRPPRDGAQKPE